MGEPVGPQSKAAGAFIALQGCSSPEVGDVSEHGDWKYSASHLAAEKDGYRRPRPTSPDAQGAPTNKGTSQGAIKNPRKSKKRYLEAMKPFSRTLAGEGKSTVSVAEGDCNELLGKSTLVSLTREVLRLGVSQTA